MSYDEFKILRASGQVVAGIDQSKALRLIEYLPKNYQSAHAFWSWVWMLSIPAAIALSAFYRWWAGLAVLVLVTPAIFSGTKASAAQFVLEFAEADRAFFESLVAADLLEFKPAPHESSARLR